MLKRNKVTDAITAKYSFEAGVIDMFKNIFKMKDNTKFDPKDSSRFEEELKKLLEKTFLKDKWVKDNCKEVVELDNHKFPFLSMVETSEEFVTSEDLVKAVKTFNDKLAVMLKPYLEVLKWGKNVFETVNKQMFAVRPNDKEYIEGLVEDVDLTEEEYEKGIAIIDAAITKYLKQFEKKDNSLKPIDFKFSSYLENRKSNVELVGKSKTIKITIEEMIKFLHEFKKLKILDPWDFFDGEDIPPYFDHECPLYAFEYGATDFHQYTFGSHTVQNYYEVGSPEDFFSTETLVDVLKEFIE